MSSLDAGKLLKDYLLAHPEMLLPGTCSNEKEMNHTIQVIANQFTFSGMVPYKASQVFLYSNRFLLLVDLEDRSLVYCREIDHGRISLSENTLLICRNNNYDNVLCAYNAKNGELLHSWNIEDLMSEEDDKMPDIRNAVLSPDGTKAVVSFYVNELSASFGKKAFTERCSLILRQERRK